MNDYGIVANYDGDQYVTKGTKCYITFMNSGNAQERVQVWCHSRGGRGISRFVDTRRLSNFRAAWIPEHVRTCEKNMGSPWCQQEMAAQLAEGLETRFGGKVKHETTSGS